MKDNIKDSWFQFIKTNYELKSRIDNIKKMKKNISPFTLEELEEDEQKIAKYYYDKKTSVNSCPLFLDQLKDKLPYRMEENRTSNFIRNKCNVPHVGQRKLLMTEVWFLSQYNLQNIEKRENPPIVIYPGAAPGTHILYLAKLFPNIEFHLYDMSNYDSNLKDNNIKPKNVKLHQQLFLDNESQYWEKQVKNGIDVYLISDIRALTGSEDTIEKKENVVHVDNILQYKWIEEIRPVSAMIKWRVPFTFGEPFRYKYLSGEVLLQSWGGIGTSETRLIVERPKNNKPYKYKTIKNTIFEEKLAAFNNTIKSIAYFNHPLRCSGFSPYDKYESSINKSGLGMDHCWNCTSELLIWCFYLGLKKKIILEGSHREIFSFMKINQNKLLKLFNDTTRSLCRSLQINCHGLLPYKTHKEKEEHFGNMNNPDKNRFLQDLDNIKKNNKKTTKLHCFYKNSKTDQLFFQGKSSNNKSQKDKPKSNKSQKDKPKSNKKENKKTQKELERRKEKGQKIGEFFEIK